MPAAFTKTSNPNCKNYKTLRYFNTQSLITEDKKQEKKGMKYLVLFSNKTICS